MLKPGFRARLHHVLFALVSRSQRLIYRSLHPDATRLVRLHPEGTLRGQALLAHVIEPLLVNPGSAIPTSHTHFGEALAKVQSLLDLGFAVDVISYRNSTFEPKRQYDILISSRVNFERLAKLVGPNCIKIVDLDIAHWLFNNMAATKRLLDLQQRRKITLNSYRLMEEVWAIEQADYAFMKGSQFTYETYRFADKPIFQLPNPAIRTYPWPAQKDFHGCRTTFLWLGSRGPVHKGLDLVLEAFAEMPDYNLVVFGPVADDRRFVESYRKELFHTRNIEFRGWIDVASTEFEDAARGCIGLIYPSAAEGCAGAVITCMHAGLLPIVSYESGVELPEGCGTVLEENSIQAIRKEIHRIAGLPAGDLELMARKIWEHARAWHTQGEYHKAFKNSLTAVLEDQPTRRLSGFVRLGAS